MTPEPEQPANVSMTLSQGLSDEETAAFGRVETKLAALFMKHGKDVRICRAIERDGTRTISFRSFPTSAEPEGREVAALPTSQFTGWPPDYVLGAIERLLRQEAA